MRWSRLAACVVVWSLFGAIHAGCVDYFSKSGDGRKITLEGEAQFSSYEAVPETRILFIIDVSQSMAVQDPDQRRSTATGEVIDRLSALGTVEFGMIAFDGRATNLIGPDAFFTSRLDRLTEAVAQLGQASGPTSFDEALVLAEVAVTAEATLMTTQERAQAYFHLVFLSDGLPDVQDPETGVNTPESIISQVERLAGTRIELGLAELSLHTAYLAANAPEDVRAQARSLMAEMAMEGGGRFLEFNTADQLSFDTLSFVDRLSTQPPLPVLVLNLNLVAGPEGPLPDSDADGIGDAREEALGLDPLRRDTDGDGYSDLVELLLGDGYDPAWTNFCASRADPDRDGLADCEEEALGTHPYASDPDQDGLPDGIEIRSGTDPWQAEHPAQLWSQPGPSYWYEITGQDRAAFEYRAEDLPLVPGLSGHNSLFVWVDRLPRDSLVFEGRFEVACLDLAQPFARLPDTLLVDSTEYTPPGEIDWRPGGGCLPPEP